MKFPDNAKCQFLVTFIWLVFIEPNQNSWLEIRLSLNPENAIHPTYQ